jgi:hypothetical protein
MANLQLFVNTSAQTLAQALVRSVTDMTPVGLPQLVLGDNRTYELYLVDGLGNYATFSGNASYIPYIAIGQCGYPTGGTFTLTFSGFTTSALAWNASPATIQAALQALTSIGANNCTVAGVAGEWMTVTFIGALANAAQPAITTTTTLLTPASTITDYIVVTGGGGLNCVQLLSYALNPISFANTWSTITNGWTGQLSTATLAVIETFAAAGGNLNETFQITIADPSGNFLTYLQAPVVIDCTIINPSSFAGNYSVPLATQAALNAAVLGLNNFTREALTSSATGNTNISPATTSRHHTAVVTVTGTAGTRTLSVITSNSPNAGDTVLIVLLPGATSGVIIEVHNATSGGTLLTSYTTDTASQLQTIVLGYSGSAWQLESDSTQMLPKSGNLAGIASPITARANLKTLFSRVVAETVSFTAATSDDGTLFQITATGGAVVATIPAASTAGAGFMIGLMKMDSTANQITTSPTTVAIGSAGQVIVLVSNGTAWNPVLQYNAGSTPPTLAETVLNFSFITDIGGSTATSLNGQPTAAGALPSECMVMISYSGIPQFWQLQPSTASTGSGVQRPTDFNASTNAQVWFLISEASTALLRYTQVSDITNITIPANTTTTVLAALNFTVTNPAAQLEVLMQLGGFIVNSTASLYDTPSASLRVLIDATTTYFVSYYRGVAYVAASTQNLFMPLIGGAVNIGVLTAGVHTIAVQVYATEAGLFNCRPTSSPNYEFLNIQLMQRS